jgi:hypothetical protein
MTDEVWEEGRAILTTAKKMWFLGLFLFHGLYALPPDTFKSYTDGTQPEYNMEINSEDHV